MKRSLARSCLSVTLKGKRGTFRPKMVKVTTVFLWLCIEMLFIETCRSWRRRRRRRRRRTPVCIPSDCRVSGWSNWGSCSSPCGTGGIQWRTRRVTSSHNSCGQCPFHMRESKRCNVGLCANYGRPHSSGCHCRSRYTGTCCRAGEFSRSKY